MSLFSEAEGVNEAMNKIRHRLPELLQTGFEANAIDNRDVAKATQAIKDMENGTLFAVLMVGFLAINDVIEEMQMDDSPSITVNIREYRL